MITQYGMSERFGLMGLADVQSQYLDGRAVLNCGDATATEIDHEVMELLKKSYDEAKGLLAENREVMDKIAEFLIEKETITGKEFMKIFREVKGIPEPEGEENKEYRILQRESKENVETPDSEITTNKEPVLPELLEPAEEEQPEASLDQAQEVRQEDIPNSEEKETITED